MKKLLGDRAFYRMTLRIVIPVIIQNGLTNFVGLLDNVMVGRIGTEQMSGVAISNQLLFIFNLCIFGAVSGAGIFTAQYYGSGDHKGVRNTTLFKLISCSALTIGAIVLLIFHGPPLISLFLEEDSAGSVANTLMYGRQYLDVMLVGLLPFALTQSYAGSLRDCGETRLPMFAGISAILINLVLNYILIFGKFGAPVLGVRGAAIATVISRFAELAIIVIVAHLNKQRYPFFVGLYTKSRLPAQMVGSILRKGMPLMINEVLWSVGVTAMMQSYSTRGLSVVAALNITSTVSNLFSVVFFSMGNAIAIIVGQQLGARKYDEARTSAGRLITLGLVGSICIALLMSAFAPFIPLVYNTTDYVRSTATSLLICAAIIMPLNSFAHCCYFTLRSGGKTFITFLFDSTFVWLVSVPVAYILSRFTDLPIIPLYFICQSLEIIKCIIGFIMVKKGIWVNNIIDNQKEVHPIEQN